MKFNLVIILFLLSIGFHMNLLGQNIKLDYGKIDKGTERTKEIVLRTKTNRVEQIVRIGAPENEFDVRLSSREVSSVKPVTIRIKFNPRVKGNRSFEIPVYFSDSNPIVIEVNADVNYLEWEDYTPCPDFTSNEKPGTFIATFKVVNALNGEPIKNATISIREQEIEQVQWKTNKKGIIEKSVPLGYYTIYATAESYDVAMKESYINRRNKYFIFALEPKNFVAEKEIPEEPVSEKEKEEILFIQEAEPDVQINENKAFSLKEFAPNNVVFLIDVSTSMKREDRLETLKESMIELLDLLRPEDKLSIITYASSTDVVLKATFVKDKKSIEEVIKSLEGKGLTAGEAGMKKAYAMAKKNYISGGNNQVYLATDGAFNKGETDMSRYVKKQKRQGVYLSIVAVKSPEWTIPKMKKIAADGNGNYVQMQDFEKDRSKLSELVKNQSKISK